VGRAARSRLAAHRHGDAARGGFLRTIGPELRTASRQVPLSAMPREHLTPAAEDRAVEIQLLLADRGRHRAPSVPDLLLAAAAELAGLVVLHRDNDFDLIAEITGQVVERLTLAATVLACCRAGGGGHDSSGTPAVVGRAASWLSCVASARPCRAAGAK